MPITNNLPTRLVDKRILFSLALLASLSGCVTLGEDAEQEHVHAPGCGHTAVGVTFPYYIPEQSLRIPRHSIPHGHHIPPLPGTGDVVYAKQNRNPVRTEYQHMPAHDAGAAYDIDGNQHVLVRSSTATVQNGWEENPLGTRPHYRDPECFHPATGLGAGYVDRCGEPAAETGSTPEQPLQAQVERVIRQPFSSAPFSSRARDLAAQMGGAVPPDPMTNPAYQAALERSRELNSTRAPYDTSPDTGDLPYCEPFEFENCTLPK